LLNIFRSILFSQSPHKQLFTSMLGGANKQGN
jgi:hypothetical protein